ncbi:MAG: globin family protein [Chloroflexota bacterium]|nr:globin family protein [Chloroflexota bacterium]
MSLSNEQKTIVQATFAQVADADLLAARFYERLFEIDPATKALFKGDMSAQRMKLMQTIAVVVNALNDLDSIVPAIQSLGARHATYGVTPAHWDSVGSALLWALEDAFGTAFTSDVRDAWASAYGLIAQTAQATAQPA